MKLIKYVVVGAVNFIVSMALFLFLLKILNVDYLVSFTFTWLFGILLTYIINFMWVFKPHAKLEFKKRMPKYFLVYVCSYLVNLLLLGVAVSVFSLDPFWIQFSIIPVIVVINFLGFKCWALK